MSRKSSHFSLYTNKRSTINSFSSSTLVEIMFGSRIVDRLRRFSLRSRSQSPITYSVSDQHCIEGSAGGEKD